MERVKRNIEDDIKTVSDLLELNQGLDFETRLKDYKEFFTTYNMQYEDINSWDSHEYKNIGGSNSRFNKIIRKTSAYERKSNKIDRIQNSLNKLLANNISKGIETTSSKEKYLRSRIEFLNNKKVTIQNKQRLLMVYNETIIRKRTNKIAKLSQKMESANSYNKKTGISNRIVKLSNKKLSYRGAKLMYLKDFIKYKVFKPKYDETGNTINDSWSNIALHEREKKGFSK